MRAAETEATWSGIVAPFDKARSLTIRGRDKELTRIWIGNSEPEVRINTFPIEPF